MDDEWSLSSKICRQRKRMDGYLELNRDETCVQRDLQFLALTSGRDRVMIVKYLPISEKQNSE